ncbi:MAG TPA: porin [Pirellulaceae bacterium]|jgi:phosphate-selective porin OprO/OprP
MAKHAAPFVRCLLALLALTAPLVFCCAVHAQPLPVPPIVENPPAAENPPVATETPQPEPTEAVPDIEARLKSVESQLGRVLDRDEGRIKAPVAAPKPSFQPGGQMQVDSIYIGQNTPNRDSVGPASDVFDFRRARLTGRGEILDVVEYSVGFDFAQSGRPTFLDNWIAVKELPILGNVRAGHFFEPFSLERYSSNRYGTFMERSLADAFAPARNLGIMAHDTWGENEDGTWAVGWFRANSNNFGDDFSSVDGNALTTRMTWLPYYDQDRGGRSFIHVGAAYSFRAEDQRQIQFESFPEARQGTPGTPGIPPFVDTGIIAANNDQRLGLELAVVHGPLYVQSEYMCSRVDQIGGPSLFFQGAYGFVSYFLTGENRTYSKRQGTIDRVYPNTNFFRVRTNDGIETGWGAWEVAARWSYIDLNNQNIQGGRLNDATLTLNWHLNPYFRIRWEYIYAMLNRAPIGPSFAQIGGMRFDWDF